MKKYTQKAGFKFRFPWRKNTFQKDLGDVQTQKTGFKFKLPWKKNTLQKKQNNELQNTNKTLTSKKNRLDFLFLELCDKKKDEVDIDNTKRKGLLYHACKKIYKNKFINNVELKTIQKTNENKRADELLAQYYRNLGQKPPTPKPIYNRQIKKTTSPQYNGL
jgi:hypothetical protein